MEIYVKAKETNLPLLLLRHLLFELLCEFGSNIQAYKNVNFHATISKYFNGLMIHNKIIYYVTTNECSASIH